MAWGAEIEGRDILFKELRGDTRGTDFFSYPLLYGSILYNIKP